MCNKRIFVHFCRRHIRNFLANSVPLFREKFLFLPRDAMRKRGLSSPGVRLSVCHVCDRQTDGRIRTAENIVKLLSRPGNPIFLLFDPERRYKIPGEIPSAAAQNTRRVGKSAIFDGNPRLSWKRYEIGPWLLWNVNRRKS